MKKIKYVLLPFFSLCLFLSLCEISGFLYYNNTPAKKMFSSERNIFIQNWDEEYSCSFPETIISHPNLGYIHRQKVQRSPYCTLPVNNIGLATKRDLPVIKNKNEFRIMLLGGSVAHQLSNYETLDGKIFLEDYLNKNYKSPNGFPFVVSTGAAGAWKMPNQLIMTMTYSNRIDAIISLDGYNESYSIKIGRYLEENYGATTYIAGQSYNSSLFNYLSLLRTYRIRIKKYKLDHLYTSFILYHNLVNYLVHNYVSEDVIEEFSNKDTQLNNINYSIRKKLITDQFSNYILKLHSLSKFSNLLSAHFLQPTRYYGKKLTESEKNFQDSISSREMDEVRSIYNQLSKTLPIVDLSELYKNEEGEIFVDHIHCDQQKGKSRGYELMAKAIAENIAKMWKLKKISSHQSPEKAL
jgi:hypothetical protein